MVRSCEQRKLTGYIQGGKREIQEQDARQARRGSVSSRALIGRWLKLPPGGSLKTERPTVHVSC